jgi:DnaK suppressor protein
MSPDQLARFRDMLSALERDLVAELAGDIAANESVVVDNAIGRLTRMEAIQSQAMEQAVRRRQEQRLQRVRRALARIEEGRFGTCTRCGSDIPPGRLEVMPESGLCVGCSGRGR